MTEFRTGTIVQANSNPLSFTRLSVVFPVSPDAATPHSSILPATPAVEAVAGTELVTPTAAVPYIQAARPSYLQACTRAELLPIDAKALEDALYAVNHAHSPQTRNHRGAAVVFYTGVDGSGRHEITVGVNTDTAMRGKSCAEIGALTAAEGSWNRIESIIVTSFRNREGSPPEPPAAPCGGCRTQLLSDISAQLGRPGADENTRLVLVGSNPDEILVTRMADLMPLHFLSGAFDANRLKSLGLASLSVVSRAASLNSRDPLYGLTAKQLEQIVQTAEVEVPKSVSPLTGKRMGAAVLLDGDSVIGGALREISAIDGGRSATIAAIQKGIAYFGTEVVRAVAVCAPDNARTGGITPLDGTTLQYLFHFAQVAGIDFPVIFAREKMDELVIACISDLLPLGEGPADSRSTRANLADYRRVNGKAGGTGSIQCARSPQVGLP